MYDTLNSKVCSLLTLNTIRVPREHNKSSDAGRGLEAYLNISSWYTAMPPATKRELMCKVMRPAHSTKESGAAEMLEEWT